MTVQASLLSCLDWENYCYTHKVTRPIYARQCPRRTLSTYRRRWNTHAKCISRHISRCRTIRVLCARSAVVLSCSWVHVPRQPRFYSALDFPHGYRDMTFAPFALHPRKSESNLLMFLIAPLPGLTLPQDGAECLFAWFHIVTARSTIVAYRYLR